MIKLDQRLPDVMYQCTAVYCQENETIHVLGGKTKTVHVKDVLNEEDTYLDMHVSFELSKLLPAYYGDILYQK